MKNLKLEKMKPALIILGILVGITSINGQEKITKTYTGIDEIEISVSSGDAIFKKSTSNEVTVELIHTFDIDYDPTIRQNGSKLDIDDRNVARSNRSYSGKATWTFTIPDNLEVEFETGSGDAEIADLTLEFEMSSGSGDFEIRNSDGEIEISTGSGDIDATDVTGDLEFSTGSGDIDLDKIYAAIDASTGSGNVDAENITISDGSSFSSGSGDVEVALSETPAFDISVGSGSGDATLDFNNNEIEGTVVMQINKNKGRIRAPFSFDKEEEITQGRSSVQLRKTKKFNSKDIQVKVSSGSGTAEIIE